MKYKNTINLEGKTIDEIEFILIESYKHPDTLYILPKNSSYLFFESSNFEYIGNWDISHVKIMIGIFCNSKFNGDISDWDVSNITNMSSMFENSSFNGDISKWNTSNVENMIAMFTGSKFTGDISKWDVSSVKSMNWIFKYSNFNKDISKWNTSDKIVMCNFF